MNYDELEEKVLESIDSSPKFAQQTDFAESSTQTIKESMMLLQALGFKV